MIKKVNNRDGVIANQIYTVFQRAYNIEAQLVGVVDFLPLSRSANNIENADSDFYGFIENNCLAAVIEITVSDKQLDIHSLTVDPEYFRRGIADKLISHVLNKFEISLARVETAVANQPAINLYKKHGFIEYKRWVPSHGIEKLAMSVTCDG